MSGFLNRLFVGWLTGLLAGLALVPSAPAAISEFRIPTAKSAPQGITAGPDGALWFTERDVAKIGRITTSGTVNEFPVPTAKSGPSAIAVGPDGAIWFTEAYADKIGRITTSGTVREFSVPTPGGDPFGLTAGPDGALWFTELAGKIGRLVPSGSSREFPAARPSELSSIASGPDGALWFTESSSQKIGRITTSGRLTEFAVPTSYPDGITAGPDGALWFTEQGRIGRITTSGALQQFRTPTPESSPAGITTGPDRALWFTEVTEAKIGRVTTAGNISEFPIPTVHKIPPLGSEPEGITAGPDGALWFTEEAGDKIGRITTTTKPGCVVPRLRGLNIRAAKRKLDLAGCLYRARGKGQVVSTSPRSRTHTSKIVLVRARHTRPLPAYGGKCKRPRHGTSLKGNSKIVLYSQPSEYGKFYFACLRSTGRRRFVTEESYSDAGFHHVHSLRLRSHWVSVYVSVYVIADPSIVYTERFRVDIRNGRRHRISFRPGVCVGDCGYETIPNVSEPLPPGVA